MQKKSTDQRVVCYVGNEGETTLRCPECKETRKIDVKRHHHFISAFKTTCTCGATIRGKFDFRRYYRKKVSLPGAYIKAGSDLRGEVRVENISGMGVGFSCFEKHTLKRGDYLDIMFTLDNPAESAVALWMQVMNTHGDFVGAKRCDTQLEQPDLDVYLR